jgi:hypothetical protein
MLYPNSFVVGVATLTFFAVRIQGKNNGLAITPQMGCKSFVLRIL